jgi:hypothetical protein
MISPSEFGNSHNCKSLGSFRLEVDRSYTPVDQLQKYAEKREFAETIFMKTQGQLAIKLFEDSDEPEK